MTTLTDGELATDGIARFYYNPRMAKPMTNGGPALKHAGHMAWRKVADEAVILDVDTANYYSLSGTGLRAWELLGKGCTPAALTAALEREYEAPPGVIAQDVSTLLSELKRQGLVEAA